MEMKKPKSYFGVEVEVEVAVEWVVLAALELFVKPCGSKVREPRTLMLN